jgi:hypothetical protein
MFQRTASVDYDLLRTIRSMTSPFEVRARSLADWERTILKSFDVWRKLIANNGGTVIGDVEAGTLDFEPPSW